MNSTICQGKTSKGLDCCRKANEDSEYCWQHPQSDDSKNCPITGEVHCKCDNKMKGNGKIDAPTVKETLRKLFTDHANFTHLFVLSAIFNLPNLEPIKNRLLQNQVDIGDFTKPVIGVEKGTTLTKLLKAHIIAAAGVVGAAKLNKGVNEAVKILFQNSAEVAQFLSSLNPTKLPYKMVHTQFDMHNQYVIDLTKLYLGQKYQQAVVLYDAYYNHMLAFSDLLASALT
jgi:hypothetical protein